MAKTAVSPKCSQAMRVEKITSPDFRIAEYRASVLLMRWNCSAVTSERGIAGGLIAPSPYMQEKSVDLAAGAASAVLPRKAKQRNPPIGIASHGFIVRPSK